MQKWLSVLGIGKDGILGLNPVALTLVSASRGVSGRRSQKNNLGFTCK
jgi:precorrin-6B methylase 1